MRHLSNVNQLEFQHKILKTQMQQENLVCIKPVTIIKDEPYGYRLKARLRLKWVAKKKNCYWL